MISIVIPSYNEEKFIGRLLQSVSEQDFDEDIEVVLADAQSKDGTREAAKSFENKFARLLIVDGGTPAVGRNNGGKAGSGNPIYFIDADLILPHKNFLKDNTVYFRERNLAAAAAPLRPEGGKFIDRLLVGSYNFILRPSVFIRPLGSMCIMASREIFEKTGGYPEDVVMAEDHDFVLKCSKLGKYRILPVPAYFSVRRLNKEGRLGLTLKYLKASLMRVFTGPIKKFDYQFDYSEKDINGKK